MDSTRLIVIKKGYGHKLSFNPVEFQIYLNRLGFCGQNLSDKPLEIAFVNKYGRTTQLALDTIQLSCSEDELTDQAQQQMWQQFSRAG